MSIDSTEATRSSRVPDPVASTVTTERAPEFIAPERLRSVRRRRNRLSRWVLFHATPLAAYLWSRVLVFGAAVVSVAFINPKPVAGPWPRVAGPPVPLLQAFARWDGAWYLDVAVRGYADTGQRPSPDASFAFFPGFPALTHLLATVTGLPEIAVALILNFVLGGVCAVLVWRLVRLLSGERAADRAVALFCFAPGAFVLSMAYSEALFIAATAACLLLMVKRNWYLAGVAGAVATFSRPTGVALLAACGIAAGIELVRNRNWRAMAAPVIASTGVLGYFAYLWARTGDPTRWFTVQRVAWEDRIAPLEALMQRYDHVRAGYWPNFGDGGLNDVVWASGIVLGLVCAVFLWRWRPPSVVAVYGLAAAGFAAVSVAVGLRPRMLLTAFPLLVAVGVTVTGWRFRLIAITSGTLMVLLAVFTFSTLAATP